MQLPYDLISKGFIKPRLFLCETDKTKVCQLHGTGLNGKFQFNSISDISFEVGRVYDDVLVGNKLVNPYYSKIETPRLVLLEEFGYFEIQEARLSTDGIKESKSVSAKSLECVLAQKYLNNFYVNTGEDNSIEVIMAANINDITPVSLYNEENPNLSLLDLILREVYGWSVGYVHPSLRTLSRKFDIDRTSIYDFIVNDLCPAFNCYAVFDTIQSEINFYPEARTSKFIADGDTRVFTINPPFSAIGTVSVGGYKTTQYTYNASTGSLILTNTPEANTYIEAVSSGMEDWETDVCVAFNNLLTEANVEYDADSIKTVLTVTYGDDETIRESNLGSPDLMDLSYYHTVDWMGQDLYDAYTAYMQKMNNSMLEYTNRSQEMLEVSDKIWWETSRLSLHYMQIPNITEYTVRTDDCYVRGGDATHGYYYTEVSLPDDFNVEILNGDGYFQINSVHMSEEKVSNLFEALQSYFTFDVDSPIEQGTVPLWKQTMLELANDFAFLDIDHDISEPTELNTLISNLESSYNTRFNPSNDSIITTFLRKLWPEIGLSALEQLYYEPYKLKQSTLAEQGWSAIDNENYGRYYPTSLVLETLEFTMNARKILINDLQDDYDELAELNSAISTGLALNDPSNFTQQQLVRLSSFLRYDELKLDDIVTTDEDSLSDTFKVQQNAMESGRIELSKISQPQLTFSMNMANIYALKYFAPIVEKFQLGNVIKIKLRDDYIKQSRLMGVNIDFEDFSNFSVEFGDLTTLRTQSDIHADLLKKAISAGKQVASNANIWTSGADTASKTDLKIQQGLISATNSIKSIDGNQDIEWDNYGLHLRKKDEDNVSGYDDEQAWFINNQLLFTDDNWKTSKMALGKFTVDGQEYFGLISDAIFSGYVEGTRIEGSHINGTELTGGTIQIGEQPNGSYAFEVDENGRVTMSGGIAGSTMEEIIQPIESQVDDINQSIKYRIEITSTGPTTFINTGDSATLTCKVYSWGDDITSTLTNVYFNWIRSSQTSSLGQSTITASDTAWNQRHRGRGMTSIEIDHRDILENSVFTCNVSLPEE